MNDQRKVIFAQRREIMEAKDVDEIVADMRHQVIHDLVDDFMPPALLPRAVADRGARGVASS